jgi:hypothetical protein
MMLILHNPKTIPTFDPPAASVFEAQALFLLKPAGEKV